MQSCDRDSPGSDRRSWSDEFSTLHAKIVQFTCTLDRKLMAHRQQLQRLIYSRRRKSEVELGDVPKAAPQPGGNVVRLFAIAQGVQRACEIGRAHV